MQIGNNSDVQRLALPTGRADRRAPDPQAQGRFNGNAQADRKRLAKGVPGSPFRNFRLVIRADHRREATFSQLTRRSRKFAR